MIHRIRAISTLPDYRLSVLFDDGKKVVYNVAEDIRDIPDFRVLSEVPSLFQQVQLDQSRTCVFWNDTVDIASDMIYEYGLMSMVRK